MVLTTAACSGAVSYSADTAVAAGNGDSVSASADAHFPIGGSGFRATLGATADRYDFSVRASDAAVEIGAEFMQDEEPAAELMLRPGVYFGASPRGHDFDCPVEAWSGVPVPGQPAISGVAGIQNGRFYHHPFPIAGVIWTCSNRWRLEAVYPEPALVYAASPAAEYKLGGELIGGGFLLQGRAQEYYAYRVGLTATWGRRPSSARWVISAGDQIEKNGRAGAYVSIGWRAGN